MLKIFFSLLFLALALSCNDRATSNQPAGVDTTSNRGKSETRETLSTLPTSVIYRNWEAGNPENAQLIFSAYKAWDSGSVENLARYCADTIRFDLPDGRRITATNKTIGSLLGRYRKTYKETLNVPFSLVSLHNKDLDQEWVIAWTWNTWRYTDGVKDSMLYCDNWRLKDGKIMYLNSLQNKPSKVLSKTLSKRLSK